MPGEIVVLAAAAAGTTTRPSTRRGGMELVVPARISPTRARARARSWRVDAFVRVGCTGLARVDFFVDGERVLVNELNTMPGFTETSVYGKLWEATGVPLPGALRPAASRIALERHAPSARYARV